MISEPESQSPAHLATLWSPSVLRPSTLAQLLGYQSGSGFLSLDQSPGVSHLLPESSKPWSYLQNVSVASPSHALKENGPGCWFILRSELLLCGRYSPRTLLAPTTGAWGMGKPLPPWIPSDFSHLRDTFSLAKAALLSTTYSSKILGIWVHFHNQI